MIVAQKWGTIDKDGDTVKAVDEGEADAEDDVVEPLWTRCTVGLPCLETHHGRRPMQPTVVGVDEGGEDETATLVMRLCWLKAER